MKTHVVSSHAQTVAKVNTKLLVFKSVKTTPLSCVAMAGALLVAPALLPQHMLFSSAALAACKLPTNSYQSDYHVSSGSACDYGPDTPFVQQHIEDGVTYSRYWSVGAQKSVVYVTDPGSTLTMQGNAQIVQGGGAARHAVHALNGGTIDVEGNLWTESNDSSNTRALMISSTGTINVGGDLLVYRHGSGGASSAEVEKLGVLNVERDALIYSNAPGTQAFRSDGTSTFKKNLNVVLEGQDNNSLLNNTALRLRSGSLSVADTLSVRAVDSVGVLQHRDHSILTAKNLNLRTERNGEGNLSSDTSADGYRIEIGEGTFDVVNIDAQGRGVVFSGDQAQLNLGMGESTLIAEPGVATLAVGADASITAAQTAIVFEDAAVKSYTLLEAGAEVTGQTGLYADGSGDATLVLNEGVNASGSISMGGGADTLILNGNVDLSHIAELKGGEELSSADGSVDTVVFKDTSGSVVGSKFVNWEKVAIDAGTLTFSDNQLITGSADGQGLYISNGGTLQGGSLFNLTGNMDIGAGSVFSSQGNGSGLYRVSANVKNAGTLSLQNNAVGDVFHVQGDYVGSGGLLALDTVLASDDSASDRLVIDGATHGTSQLKVVNKGGAGALTVADGINVIQVAGPSNGTFILSGDYQHNGQSAVVAGAYAYKLYKNGVQDPNDGNWYLRSQLDDPTEGPEHPLTPAMPQLPPLYQAGVPVYEAYPQVLLGLNSLPTLQQRVGNRVWSGAGNTLQDATTASAGAKVHHDQNGLWGRVEGSYNRMSPRRSTSNAQYEVESLTLQLGVDGLLQERESGKLMAGIHAKYTQGSAKVWSPHDADGGKGKIKTDGLGFGTTLTWYGNNGVYLDGQAQAMWYDSDLSSEGGRQKLVSKNDGFGYAFSAEGGKRIALNQHWSMTPQAQLTYSNVSFENFVDTFGAKVKRDRNDSLQGRLGLAVERQNQVGSNRSLVYGIANLYYDFLNGTRVQVAERKFTNRSERLFAGIGIGGSYNWGKDKYSVYGEGSINSSVNRFGDSYGYKGIVGLRIKW